MTDLFSSFSRLEGYMNRLEYMDRIESSDLCHIWVHALFIACIAS